MKWPWQKEEEKEEIIDYSKQYDWYAPSTPAVNTPKSIVTEDFSKQYDWYTPSPQPEPEPHKPSAWDNIKEGAGSAIGKGASWLGGNLMAGVADSSGAVYRGLQSVGLDKVPGINKVLDWGVDSTEQVKQMGGTDIGSQVVRSLPGAAQSMGLALLSGGSSVPAQLGANTTIEATKQLATNPAFLNSALRSYGSTYGEAVDEGAGRGQAIKAGLLSAIPQAAIEVSGGLEQIPNRAGQGLLKTIGRSALEEGMEEVMQYPFEGLAKKATYAPDTPMFSTQEQALLNPGQMAQAGLVGGLAGGLFGGVGGVANRAMNRPIDNINTHQDIDLGTEQQPDVLNNLDPPIAQMNLDNDLAIGQQSPLENMQHPEFTSPIDEDVRITGTPFETSQDTITDVPFDTQPNTQAGLETATTVEPDSFTVETDEGTRTYDSKEFVDDKGNTLAAHLNEDPTYRELSEELKQTSSQPDNYIQNHATEIKDKSGAAYNIDQPFRGLKNVFGKHWDHVKKNYFDTFDKSKGDYAREVTTRADKIYNEVVEKHGIKKGSKESAAIQWYGEGERIRGSDKNFISRALNPEYETITNDAGQEAKIPKMEKYTLGDLKRDFPNKWKNIVESEKLFRQQYDEMIDLINESRKKVYPSVEKQVSETEQRIKDLDLDVVEYKNRLESENLAQNEIKQINRKIDEMSKKSGELSDKLKSGELWRNKRLPKRDNYFRHFKEMNSGVVGLFNIIESPSHISSNLAGISEYTKPKSKWASFMQQRGLGDYTADAVGGFIDYLRPASHAVHIDPHITKFRQLAKDIADGTSNTGNANNLILYLNDYANSLAGKTNKFDRLAQDMIPGGRKTFAVINWFNNRARANAVLGNLRSSITQVANMPAGISEVNDPAALSKGMGETLANVIGKGNKAIEQSDFISERYMDSAFEKFDTKLTSKPKQFAAWLLGVGDELGTRFTWNSAYQKALKSGEANPMKYADDLTRGVVGGRGVGEVPLIQQSKLFQTFFPFTLEVGNIAHVMAKQVKGKEFGKLMTFMVANFLFNGLAESLYGDRPLPDPIDAMMDALSQEDANIGTVAGRLGGEVLSNVPGGQTIASLWPQYETDVKSPLGEYSIPSRQQLFGDSDPTRFGSGFLLQEAIKDPFYKLALPWGGGQLKKTVQGAEALAEGGVVRDDKLRFLTPPTTENILKSTMFGRNATPEAREYFDNDSRPLSEKQTQQVFNSDNPQAVYENVLLQRELEKLNQQIPQIASDPNLSNAEKDRKINGIRLEMEKKRAAGR